MQHGLDKQRCIFHPLDNAFYQLQKIKSNVFSNKRCECWISFYDFVNIVFDS